MQQVQLQDNNNTGAPGTSPPSPASDTSLESINSEHISVRSRFAHIKFRPTQESAKFGVVVFFSLFIVILSIVQIIRGVDYQEVYFGMLFWIIGLYTPGPQRLLKPKPSLASTTQSFSKV